LWADTLPLEVDFPELELMKPIFYAQREARILAVYIGRLCSDFAKFQTFEMEEANDIAGSRSIEVALLSFVAIYIFSMPAVFSRGNPTLSQRASVAPGY
jgi:hypothetical protein